MHTLLFLLLINAYCYIVFQENVLYEDFQRLMRIRPAFLNSADGNVDNAAVVGMFKDAVFQLTTSPGNVGEYLKPIVDTLKGGVNDPEIINEIIEILLEQVCMYIFFFIFLPISLNICFGCLKVPSR